MTDNELTWKTHIGYFYSKLLKFASMFHKFQCNVNSDVLRMLHFAFVPTQFLTTEFYGFYKINQNDTVLKIFTRIIILYLFLKYIKFQLLCLVHKYVYCNHQVPAIIVNYFLLTGNKDIHIYYTRSSNQLDLPHVNVSYGFRCIKFKASQL